MITIRKANERGHARHGWLESYHTFSFADYYNPAFMGFRTLCVINEDRVNPQQGFGTHPHQDMEIISYILEGALEHKDSMGTGSVIHPGEIQLMSAGTGVMHSEFNPSKKDLVHFLQMWILPDKKGLKPQYQQKDFSKEKRKQPLSLMVSPNGEEGSLKINQDVKLFLVDLSKGQQQSTILKTKRHAWVQMLKGQVQLNKISLREGDGAAVSDEEKIALIANIPARLMLFDLA